jgi:hypothetical protein
MWVLSVDAGSLLSVVKFDVKKLGAKQLAEKHGATDPEVDYLLVRARVKASLGYVAEVLEAIYAGEVEGWKKPIIESMPSADYKYRTIITRDEWKQYLLFEVDGIDYDSHVKEETVRRQPEPKVKNLYSALSATWSAWAKLQDTPPYGGGYTSKPDCKNCDHRELSHTIKGDKCNGLASGQWSDKDKVACSCTKYEPKPAPATKAKSTQTVGQLEFPGVGESQKDPVATYPSAVYGSNWDAADDFAEVQVGEDGHEHPLWCTFWDGEVCICKEDESVSQEELDSWEKIGDSWIQIEPPVPGETKNQRKARNERNRRRRQKARRRAERQAS